MPEPAEKAVQKTEEQYKDPNEKLGTQEDRAWPTKEEFTPEMLQKMEELLPGKLNRIVSASLAGCIHCGMCQEACHYAVSIPEDKTLVPAYKADRFRKWYKGRFDWMGRAFPWFVGAKKLDKFRAKSAF